MCLLFPEIMLKYSMVFWVFDYAASNAEGLPLRNAVRFWDC